MNKRLKALLVAKGWLKAEATDVEASKVSREKLKSGELSAKDYAEALAPEGELSPMQQMAAMIGKSISDAVKPLQDEIAALKGVQVPAAGAAPVVPAAAPVAAPAGEGSPDPAKLFGGAAGSGAPNVKPAKDMYTHQKSALFHGKGMLQGQPATYQGRHLQTQSEFEKACIGAWFKWAVQSQVSRVDPSLVKPGLKMTDHDMHLVKHLINEEKWTGLAGPRGSDDEGHCMSSFDNRKLSPFEAKAILDDNTSGGLEAAPIFFDDAIITTPLLFGELFPMVEVVNIPRGRRIEGATISNPTVSSNTAEGTSISLFNTTAFIAALDTTIFNAVGSMEIGMDFEEDSPINIGAVVTASYGAAFQKWLDEVIAVGDGVNEPTGIFTQSGTTAVSSVNGTSGPLTIADAEQLMFGVPKQFRNAKGGKNCFIGSEVMYRRFRATPVGTADQRRVFGMDHASYSLLDYPFKISNDIPEGSVGYANMGYYRMYRRLGMNLRVITEGQTLGLKNLMCIILRARFGGRPTLGAPFAIMSDAPATG